jgi:predicted CoA-binding protein
MDEKIKEMLSKKIWAVAGSTHNKEKYAYKVYNKLKESGYRVYSINPSLQDVDGDKSYGELNALPEKIEVISMVINPVKGKKIIEDAIKSGIGYIWFQPGAETEELIQLAEGSGIKVVYDRCVIVEAR